MVQYRKCKLRPQFVPAKKLPKKKVDRPCALCFGPLLDQETYIHDKHRGTKLAEEFLAGLSKPKLKESTPEPPKKNGKRGGRPKGSRVQFWLSKAEQEVVDLMCDGYKSNEIGKIVGKSTASVCTALDRAKRKTGARSNYHLVAMAVSKKLKEDPDHGGYWREGKERDQEDRTVGASKPSEAA